jgi:diguanylate cyclase (GGDEF)-like protein
MGVYAPEQHFSGTIREGQQQALVLAIATSIVIILAAFALSPALIRLLTAQQERATRDPLSSLLNRRSFEELAARPFDDAKRGTLALSVIMVDIDQFKQVNNKFGRQVGDEIIVAVAGRIQQVLSATDMVARYGGEEFAILLSSANIEEGSSVAERVRGAVENAPIGTSAGPVAVTVSLGVAAFSADVQTVLDLFGIAEYLMREAKRNGRNCVVSQPARGTGA